MEHDPDAAFASLMLRLGGAMQIKHVQMLDIYDHKLPYSMLRAVSCLASWFIVQCMNVALMFQCEKHLPVRPRNGSGSQFCDLRTLFASGCW